MNGVEVSVSEILILKNVVMGWSSGAFDSIMRLKEEIPIARFGDAAVHYKISFRVTVIVVTAPNPCNP